MRLDRPIVRLKGEENQVRHHTVTLGAVMALIFLLAIPSIALSRFGSSVDWRLLVGIPGLLSLVTVFAYRSDKRRAQAGEWRIPESTLHLGELMGGWPGAFMAQRIYRHKTSKTSYQVEFWGIVTLYQLVAIDSLIGWRLTKAVWHFIQTHIT